MEDNLVQFRFQCTIENQHFFTVLIKSFPPFMKSFISNQLLKDTQYGEDYEGA